MLGSVSIDCVPFTQLTLQELYDILHLRHIVFVVEQKCIFIDSDGYDQQAYHVMIKEDGKLVAYSRLFGTDMPYPGYLSIGRVVNHPDYRNKKYGKLLMKNSIEKIKQLFGDYPIKIGAQAYLKGFYSSFGFKDIGEYYMEDGIPHLKMILK